MRFAGAQPAPGLKHLSRLGLQDRLVRAVADAGQLCAAHQGDDGNVRELTRADIVRAPMCFEPGPDIPFDQRLGGGARLAQRLFVPV